MNSESTFSDALSEVDVAIAAANYERAIALTDELLTAYPDAVSVWRARARAFNASGKPFQAAEAYARVLDVVPADADAMANLARALNASSRSGEAKLAAQQAVDYESSDEALQYIAAGGDESYRSDAIGEQLREALAQARIGLLDRSTARLRKVIAQWPDRVDVQVALAQALWRDGSRVAAAELCQSILDAQPDCLNAHALLLSLWKETGPANLEQVHERALDRIDPDHRCTKALLGDASPVEILDVPAIRPAEAVAAQVEEDERYRNDWVDDLVAAASSTPKPLDRDREPSALTFARKAPQLEDDGTLLTGQATDETIDTPQAQPDQTDDVDESFLPLEWVEAGETFEDEFSNEGRSASWLSDDSAAIEGSFVPPKPTAVVPDVKDGVPAMIEPLEWKPDAQRNEPAAQAASAADEVQPPSIELAPEALDAPEFMPPEQSRFSVQPAEPTAEQTMERFAAARQAVEERNWKDAFTLYEKAVASDKDDQLKAVVHDLEAAARGCEQSNAKRIYHLLSLAYMRLGDEDAAFAAYRRAMELPEDTQQWNEH